MKTELVWIQNLKGFVRGVFAADDLWKKIFIEQLDNVNNQVEDIRGEDWENACHELLWATGHKQLFGAVQKRASDLAKERK